MAQLGDSLRGLIPHLAYLVEAYDGEKNHAGGCKGFRFRVFKPLAKSGKDAELRFFGGLQQARPDSTVVQQIFERLFVG